MYFLCQENDILLISSGDSVGASQATLAAASPWLHKYELKNNYIRLIFTLVGFSKIQNGGLSVLLVVFHAF